jgi:hypothetical protein
LPATSDRTLPSPHAVPRRTDELLPGRPFPAAPPAPHRDSRVPAAAVAIRDLLTEGPTTSFEFFPPKGPEGAAQLWSALRELE